MKILFVVNNFYAAGNGLSASARRTVRYLKEAGEDVRVLSGETTSLRHRSPIMFWPISTSQYSTAWSSQTATNLLKLTSPSSRRLYSGPM